MEYSNLELIILRDDQRGRHGNYKYLILANAMSHIAFHTKQGVKQWLSERGLTIGKRHPWGISCRINGSYIDNCMMVNREHFESLFHGKTKIKQLSNGDYTTGYITVEDGIRVINYLNPNCNREVLQYSHN